MTHPPEHDPLGDLAAPGVAVWLEDLSRESATPTVALLGA
jgi:hypothetical protein